MSDSKKDGINEGTKAKATLQLRAVDFLKGYSDNKTLESYAHLLCWDLNVSFRTAYDSYIMPLLEHGYFIYLGDNKYSFIGSGKLNKQIKKGKIGKKEIIDKDSKEDKESAMEYMQRKQKEKEENKNLEEKK